MTEIAVRRCDIYLVDIVFKIDNGVTDKRNGKYFSRHRSPRQNEQHYSENALNVRDQHLRMIFTLKTIVSDFLP